MVVALKRPPSISLKAMMQRLADRRSARTNYLGFMGYTWQKPWAFQIGPHTRTIADRFDRAIDDLKLGKSTFLNVAMPIGHGKSDLASRYFPPYFLGRCLDLHPDIIMCGYNSDLAKGFSKDAKRIINSEEYKRIFPGVEIPLGSDGIERWGVRGSTGEVNVCGLLAGITGRRGRLIVLDDYCRGRADARSQLLRNRAWDAFINDLMTRRPDPCIVIICATPWHEDDVRGRLKKHMAENPDFPQFEEMKFPAMTVNDSGETEYLFPELFSEAWYKSQYATLGKWASGLLDCEPLPEGGNRFDVNKIVWHSDPGSPWHMPKDRPTSEFPGVPFKRAWDLASSKKERDKDDPDSTVGMLGAVTFIQETFEGEDGKTATANMAHLWIKDLRWCQAEAPERNRLICDTAALDGNGVQVFIEAFGAYKDAFVTLRKILTGTAIVNKSRLQGDKSAKLADIEPVWDAGHVHVMRGPHDKMFIEQWRAFPDGSHDDFCDPAAIIYHECVRPKGGIIVT